MFKKKMPRSLSLVLVCAASLVLILLLLKLIPNKSLTDFSSRQYSTRFYDRSGNLLYVMSLDEGLRREYRSYKEFPKALVTQVVHEEDKNFFFHPGIDLTAILRAARQNKSAGRVVSGASTITMQLVRLIWPRQNKNVGLGVKVSEAFRALYLELKLSKKEILELYMNNVPFGFQIEGVTSAARSFFSKEVSELSQEEMELLSKIPRRPAEYAPEKKYVYPLESRHFINYIIDDYKKKNEILPPELHLSLNSELNELIKTYIQLKLDEHEDARIHNGAALAIENATGRIVAWVGNADFDSPFGGQIDGVLVPNQMGSSMKPFLYALSLEKGMSPATVLPDIQTDFGAQGVYVPLNFNNRYNGPVRFRVALASSLNIPAVYLLKNLGMDEYLKTLSSLGFDSLSKKPEGSLGLSLALGSAEVTLYEIVKAFTVFPNDGLVWDELSFLSDKKSREQKHRVYSQDVSRIMLDILSDSHARELGFARAKVFDTPYPSIFKTGTSNQFQNIIALGATSAYTVGVWMGNFEGETVIRQTGSSIPAAVVREALDYLTEKNGFEKFPLPEHFEKKSLCALSLMQPTEACPTRVMEFVRKGTAPEKASSGKEIPCTWHKEENGKVLVSYPSEYQHWASGKNMAGKIQTGNSEISISYPRNNSLFFYDPGVPPSSQYMRVQAIGGKSEKASLYVDDQFFSQIELPFAWNIPLKRGEHTITVTCGDSSVTHTYTVK